ncbi:MAG: branched-chain amino acid ABC transporter permease [Synergistaceae bacterium]|jgi:branched-chain amino acid transport system permease protein|nr:branched-chain amino acid ABC transporter permease [Synergistaceae bacterium]
MKKNNILIFIGFAAFLILAPVISPDQYITSVFVSFCIKIILLTGLNVILGFAGQMSMAHAGFYGLGAYTAGILAVKLSLPPLLALIAAPVAVALVAFVLGLPSLRLHGNYFGMATLGAGMVLYLVFGAARNITGGPNGLMGIPAFSLAGHPFSLKEIYLVIACFALLGLLCINNLSRSHMGFALRALSVSEDGAASVGIDAFRLKLSAFVVSGVFAGFAGGFQTFQSRFITPETFAFFPTVLMIIAIVLGGGGTQWGPVIGALLLTVADELLAVYPDLKPLILGSVFILIVLRFPGGIIGTLGTYMAQRQEKEDPAS